MRRVFNGFARALVVVSVIAALAVPAEARSRTADGPRFDNPRFGDNPIVRIVKILKLAVRTLGDGLTDPKP